MDDNVVRVVVGAVEGEGSVMQSHSVFNIEREENNALRALLNNVLNCCLRKRGGKPVGIPSQLFQRFRRDGYKDQH